MLAGPAWKLQRWKKWLDSGCVFKIGPLFSYLRDEREKGRYQV